jgi:hypothetical protein
LHGGRDLALGRVPLDERMMHLPNGYFSWHCLRTLTPPLWNPFAFGGMPHLAGSYAAVLYPPNYLFYALFEPFRAFASLQAFHYFWTGLGAWAWLRHGWRLRRGAALVGGAAFMLCGFIIGHEPHSPLVWAVAWVPWMLWCSRRVLEGCRAAGPILALVVAFQIAAGFMHVTVVTLLVLGAEALAWTLAERSARAVAWKRLAAWCGAVALGLGLMLVQFLATREILPETYRAVVSYEAFTDEHLPPPQLATLGFPLLFGADRAWSIDRPYFGAGHQPETVGAMAAPVWLGLLLLVALRGAGGGARRRDVVFWSCAGLFFFSLMLGPRSPFSPVLYRVPILNYFRILTRSMFVYELALAALAAAGFDRLLGALERGETAGLRRPIVRGCALTIAAPIALWLWLRLTSRWSDMPVDWSWFFGQWLRPANPAVWLPIAFAFAALAPLALLALARCSRKAVFIIHHSSFIILWIALLALEQGILTANVTWRGGVGPDTAAPPANGTVQWLLRESGADRGDYRVLVPTADDIRLFEETLIFQMPQLFGIRATGGNWPLIPTAWSRLLHMANYGSTMDPEGLLARPRILSMLGVRYLLVGYGFDGKTAAPYTPNLPEPRLLREVAGEPRFAYLQLRERTTRGTSILENPGALPTAWLVRRVTSQPTLERAIERIWDDDSFDPAVEAIVDPIPGSDAPLGNDFAQGTARVVERRLDRLWIDVEARGGPGFLVVSESWSPGWWARLDGGLVPIWRTNAVLRGIAVPEGRHRIYMRYLPIDLKHGLFLSMGCALLWILWLIADFYMNRARASVVPHAD